MSTHAYYNAKPSKISNIGLDVSGAKRMNFNTYETTEERQAREHKKSVDNSIKLLKAAFKTEVLSESPNRELLLDLLRKQFIAGYEFDALAPDARYQVSERRKNFSSGAAFNKMISAYNKLQRDKYALSSDYGFKYWLNKMRRRYQPKESFTEQSGATFNWNQFNSNENDVAGKVEYLSSHAKAVQFGNSVSDKERGYILIELVKFLEEFKLVELFDHIDLSPVSWSFGARGNAQSVAYYEYSRKLISVNRNNIGSLIHEVGHYIDDISGNISRKISYETVSNYRDSIKDGMTHKELSYYCKREEIFARAFEAYCFKIYAGFSDFAQTGKMFLPELNDNLIAVIKEALKIA